MKLEALFRTAWSRALCALIIVAVVGLAALATSQNAALDDDYTIALSLSIGLLYFHRHPSFREAMDLMKKMIRSFSNER